MRSNPPRTRFDEPDFRSMSLHILNLIIPMLFVFTLVCVLAASDRRIAFVWPVALFFGGNMAITSLQKKDPFRKLVPLTALRFCASFPVLCWLATLSRDTPYAWVFFLPQSFALAFSFLMPLRTAAMAIWNLATLAFMWHLEGRMPGWLPIAFLVLVSGISWAGACILERNLAMIRKLPEEDRGKWGLTIGNQAVISYLVLLGGIGLTLILVRNELDHRGQAALLKLKAQAQSGIRNLNLRLASQRSALESLSAFFEGSRRVRKSEFDTFAGRLLPGHPFIEAFQWAPLVTRKERAGFEAEVRAEFGTGYRIVQPDSGTLRPAPDKAEYFPIRFMFPFAPGRLEWGLDVGYTPERRACVDRALAKMAYTVCRPHRRMQDPRKEWVALACMPVVTNDAKGFAVALIRLEALVREAIIDPLPRDFSVDLDFLAEEGWVPILSTGPHAGAVPLEEFADAVGGTRFRLRIGAPNARPGSLLGSLDIFLLAMGIATSFLIAYFLFHARKSNLPLEIKVLERTRELQRVVIRAEEASQAKSRFLAQMSHEIRTPMNGVLGMSEALLHSDIGRDARESVELIRASGMNLLTILNDILDLSKIESGKMELDARPFQLGKLISESVGVMKCDADSRGIALELKSGPAVPEWVVGDPLRVRQILMNLLSNALKFTPKGSVTVTVGFAMPDRFQAHIVDSGIGISPEKLERLFQPFEQGDSSTTRKFGGTGLGLAISLQFAKMMGGDIQVRSEEDVGTDICLTLRLPVASPPAQAGNESAAGLRRGGRVLLAEDNIVNVRVAKALLEDYFETIDVAANGKEALDMLGAAAYEMILMDLQMPEMDGLQAAREIRKRGEWRDIPIIALTANAFSSDRRDCLAAGMQDFLVKPITKAGLHRVLEPYLAKGRD
ncbi:MAG TPA: ATP-binding protein [Fibrobacteria bacterium]|nr:ATP-binding protein [Fibrobacteria bacterium]